MGIAFDHALVYFKGGVGWTRDTDTINNVALPPLGTAFQSSISTTRVGATVGTGIEYAFAGNWSARLEYDFIDLGTDRVNFSATGTALLPNTFTNWDLVNRVHEITLGINYRFGWF